MVGDSKVRLAILLAIGVVSGCGKGSDGGGAADVPSATPSTAAAPNTEVVTKAATDFLDAVLKGDTQRASARLTPQAIERIIASGKQFAPPGLETATFRIGQVRMPSASQALVQCVLTDTPADGSPARNEEMCCLLKLVDKDWRVSGIAYGTAPNQPWMLSDFETGNSVPIPRPGARTASKPQPGAQSRPSPRTAQDPAAPAIR